MIDFLRLVETFFSQLYLMFDSSFFKRNRIVFEDLKLVPFCQHSRERYVRSLFEKTVKIQKGSLQNLMKCNRSCVLLWKRA